MAAEKGRIISAEATLSAETTMSAEANKYEVTVNLVTAVSTTANASFDKYVSVFTKRISDKAAEVFGKNQSQTTIPKST